MLWVLLLSCAGAETLPSRDADWSLINVPGTWEEQSDGKFADYDGIAWYRSLVRVPAHWKDKPIEFSIQGIDNAGQVYFEGTKIGQIGGFPPDYQNGLDEIQRFRVPAELIKPDQVHWVAVRVYDHDGRGGFKGPAPVLSGAGQAISLRGGWEFRVGDDVSWARPEVAAIPEGRPFEDLMKGADIVQALTDTLKMGGAYKPAESLALMKVPDDLTIELLLHEPAVEQPVFMSFDERGRLWVVQYRQYPHPAGLKMLSRDRWWRAVYDRVPPAPPNHFPGKDKITIHEDTDGDGAFDTQKVFVDGLSIVTAVERGRGGVWVLNPPYLLFYPDADNDDVPDGDPVVHLSGFGLEDTHSVVNSLCWGPDGWLYAAQGSTVTGNVVRPGLDKEGVQSLGQLIWRYQPESKTYEIFAEGGGNAFGCEFDSVGRVYSGHNGGDTRGFHYVQGGYYQKGFSKHGPLSNPYSFGYFPQMAAPPVERFTHNFIIYEGGSLPQQYHGKLFGVAPLQSHIVESELIPQGSTFRTEDVGHPVTTKDAYFKPVDIKVGPDGAIYIADWYDHNVNHYRNHEGNIDPYSGRIYRLRAKDAERRPPEDLGSLSSDQLVDRLADENEWVRRTAQRLLADRKDRTVVPRLRNMLKNESGQRALEALWALHGMDAWNDDVAMEGFEHANPHVRRWSVRLVGDRRAVSDSVADRLATLARSEADVEVRSQLAQSAKRLPARPALAIVRALVDRGTDLDDPHIPLLVWWAIESKIDSDEPEVLAMMRDSSLWNAPMMESFLVSRVMRRFAARGLRHDLLVAADLLSWAPTEGARKALMTGFEEAFAGRSLADVPAELAAALAKQGSVPITLGLRLGREDSLPAAVERLANSTTPFAERIEIIKTLGEVDQPSCVPAIIEQLGKNSDLAISTAALTTLGRYPGPAVGQAVLGFAESHSGELREVAFTTLASRVEWTRELLASIDAGRLAADDLSTAVVRRMAIHDDADIRSAIEDRWGKLTGVTTAEARVKMDRLATLLKEEGGTPYNGSKVFTESCGKCHQLFGQGGSIGPDLTSYKRDDLDNMLLAVIHPSAEIREGFETYRAFTVDGRAVTGFIADQDPKVVVFKTAEGQTISLERDQIDEMEKSPTSVMPEGLLDRLPDRDVRDLFAFLRSSQPLNQ